MLLQSLACLDVLCSMQFPATPSALQHATLHPCPTATPSRCSAGHPESSRLRGANSHPSNERDFSASGLALLMSSLQSKSPGTSMSIQHSSL